MAHLVPTLEIIKKFPTPLMPGEQALLEALHKILGDDWTIYVQPNLNGLQPDIIIFSEEAGMGIFEVKDWNLDSYRVRGEGRWDVHDGRQGGWINSAVRCPVSQVRSYKDDIYRYQLPELEAEKILDPQVYSLVAPFVYFHCHTTQDARDKTRLVYDPYVTVFGHDDLRPERLRRLLEIRYLKKGSYFSEMMKQYGFQNRLLNALAWPEHGQLDVSDILFKLTADQQRLMSNAPGKRRAIGVAGSGKTLLLVRKAVDAAMNGQKVLLVCFNLMMVNYLNDVVRRLVRHRSEPGTKLNDLILVRHYHRLFPDKTTLKDEETEEMGPFDVILIDEGQDFKREWIEHLYELASPTAHIMFVEDDRQNIYGVDTKARATVPGIVGRPNELKRSFRIDRDVAALANRLVGWSKRPYESGDVEIDPSPQGVLIEYPKPNWIQGDANQTLPALTEEIRRVVEEDRSGAFADLVALVCTVDDGHEVCQRLDALRLPYICNFESPAERVKLAQQFEGELLKAKQKELRRARKIAFRMQTGRIKVCTIHSFKGWELKRVLVYFHPVGDQTGKRIPLLYTAITRTQSMLTVLNVDAKLFEFGRLAAQENLVMLRTLQQSDASMDLCL